MIGSVAAAGTSATSTGDADNDVIIHAAPTDWISPPKFDARLATQMARKIRSEEHTSELQSLMRISYAVFCLKKKKNQKQTHYDLLYRHYKKHALYMHKR